MAENETFDDFFGGGGGDFAPTGKFTKDKGPGGKTQTGGTIQGEILSMSKQNQTKFGTSDPLLGPDGVTPKQELKIILQTEYTGWDKAAKVPNDADGEPLPADKDDGRRAIYVRGWMTGAIGDAVKVATGKGGAPKVGGTLAVRVSELVDTDKGNPYPKYEARYTAPSGAEGFDFDTKGDTTTKAPENLQQSMAATDDSEPPF